MLDANQALRECFTKSSIRPYSIEWLRLRRGLEDPFVALMGWRPNSTTQMPGCDIDYILTYGISINSITTIPINCPATSDHLGMILDIDMQHHFSTTFSEFQINHPRSLTSENKKSVDTYLTYVHKQINTHKRLDRVETLHKEIQNPNFETKEISAQLNTIDKQITEILLAGEKQCARKLHTKQDWEPASQLIARTYSNWKQKRIMVSRKIVNFHHLDQLHKNIHVSDYEHQSLEIIRFTGVLALALAQTWNLMLMFFLVLPYYTQESSGIVGMLQSSGACQGCQG